MTRPATATARLAVAAVLSAALLSACGDDEPTGAEDPAATAASQDAGGPTEPSTEPSTEPATEPSTEPVTGPSTEPPGETVEAEVFFVADTPRRPALFGEVHPVPAGDPLTGAMEALLSGDPDDPDYRTLVPDGSLEPHAGFDGTGADGSFAVHLTDATWTERPAGMSQREATLAVQQVVYTLQHASGPDRPTRASVTFYLDTRPVSFLGVPSDVAAARELDVRGLVNVYAPVEGDTVSGTFTAVGGASSFEATVPWQVRDAQGRVVTEGFSTAEGWIGRLHPWTAEVDVSRLAPGEYTFVAMTDDPSGGAEGFGPTEDTRTITVG